MKNSTSIVTGFFLLMISASLMAGPICETTRLTIKNDSSSDCVLTDFVSPKKIKMDTVIFKNQSIQFDVPDKSTILRYQCGYEASALLYFQAIIISSEDIRYTLEVKPTNLQVGYSTKKGVCHIFTPGAPDKVTLTFKN